MSNTLLYPTQSKHLLQLEATLAYDDDDDTVIALNCTMKYKQVECTNVIAIATSHAIADTGATLIFIMKGTPSRIYASQITQ
jgi:hypothetical protein